MNHYRCHALRASLLITTGLALVALQAGCARDPQASADSPDTRNLSNLQGVAASLGPADAERPRHRVGETDADRERIIAPWRTCMKDNGADLDTMPPSIEGAARWAQEHQSAGLACRSLLPLPPWGLDRTNPEYRENVRQWVECMNDRGLSIIATPDDAQSPWRFGGDSALSPEESSRVQQDCMKETIGKSD
jgi:hypothetical protein